jgi:drug/metabolite transporter (DMT)-like permease
MAVVGEPVGATLLAWLWLGEAVPARVALGCAVTLAAVGTAILGRKNAADTDPACP